MHILIIEDDAEVAKYIAKNLEQAGHSSQTASNGNDGLNHATNGQYDVLIVDRMLPGLDGLKIVKTLRSTGITTPALFLSALGDINNRVEGLKSGGDDYLVKPFAFAELLARLELLAGRSKPTNAQDMILTAGDVTLDMIARKVTRAGKPIPMQAREFKLLEYLIRNKNQTVTRTMLLENVWEYHFDPQTNIIDVHVSRLRQKLDIEGMPPLIRTVRGAGYTIED